MDKAKSDALIRLLRAVPAENWDWLSIVEGPLLTWEIISAFPEERWNWARVSARPKVTWDVVLANPDKPWDWGGLSLNPNLPWEEVLANPGKPWDWEALSRKDGASEMISWYPDLPLRPINLAVFSLEILRGLPSKVLDARELLEFSPPSMEMALAFPETPFNWSRLPRSSWEIVAAYSEMPWKWTALQAGPQPADPPGSPEQALELGPHLHVTGPDLGGS